MYTSQPEPLLYPPPLHLHSLSVSQKPVVMMELSGTVSPPTLVIPGLTALLLNTASHDLMMEDVMWRVTYQSACTMLASVYRAMNAPLSELLCLSVL